MKKRRYLFYIFFKKIRYNNIYNFLFLYNNFFTYTATNLFFIKKKKLFFFFLTFTFKKKMLFINLQTLKKKNIFFLSPGFFIKFFEKKKSLKKNKNIKLLMAKCLRKLYLTLKFKKTILIIRNNPCYITEILTYLNTPIIHKFEHPFSKKTIEEDKKKTPVFKVISFIFLQNINYCVTKIKKAGRIKRKILRKLIINNNITD